MSKTIEALNDIICVFDLVNFYRIWLPTKTEHMCFSVRIENLPQFRIIKPPTTNFKGLKSFRIFSVRTAKLI